MRYTALRTQLRTARLRQALTQEALAARSGTSRVTIARLEAGSAGDARVGTIASLCEALGLELAAVPAGARPALETLLARERERARRLDLHRRHAVLAARLLAAPPAAGDRPGRQGSRRGRPLGAREAVQPSLRLALAGDARGPGGPRGRRHSWSRASGETRSSRTRPGGSPWSRPLRETRGPEAPLRARARPVRRDGLRGLRKPGRARLRGRGAPAHGGVARRRRVLQGRPRPHLRPRPRPGAGQPVRGRVRLLPGPHLSPGGHLAGGLAGTPDPHPARAGPRGVVPRAERRGGLEVRAHGAPRPGVDPPRAAGGRAVDRAAGRALRPDHVPRCPGGRPCPQGARGGPPLAPGEGARRR